MKTESQSATRKSCEGPREGLFVEIRHEFHELHERNSWNSSLRFSVLLNSQFALNLLQKNSLGFRQKVRRPLIAAVARHQRYRSLLPAAAQSLVELDDAEQLVPSDLRQGQFRLKLIPIGVEGIEQRVHSAPVPHIGQARAVLQGRHQ